MNLESVLEPLLNELWHAADAKYRQAAPHDPTNPADTAPFEKGLKFFNSDLSSLVSRFRNYYTLDSYDLDPVSRRFADPSERWDTTSAHSVYGSVARAASYVDDVRRLIHFEEWVGLAAKHFHDNFLDPFRVTAKIHAIGAREMAIAAKALALGVDRLKEDVVWICRCAISLLGGDAAPGPEPGAEEGGSFKETAGLAAILADAAALFLALTGPEGDALDVVLAGVGTGGGLVAESKKSAPHEQPINIDAGQSADEILHQAWAALNRLDMNVAELDDAISRGVEKDLGKDGIFGAASARIENPHLKSSAFQQSTILKSTDTGDDAIVRATVRLYAAGYRSLPAASDEYGAGVKTCNSAHIRGAEHQFPKAVGKFNDATATFGGLLASVRDDLSRSGRAIVTAATHYHDADEYEAKRIRRLESQIPSPGSTTEIYYVTPSWLQPDGSD